jgi:hypothetical protein
LGLAFFFAILRVFVVSGVSLSSVTTFFLCHFARLRLQRRLAQLSHDPEVVPSLRSLLPRIRIKMAKKRCFCFLLFFFFSFLFFLELGSKLQRKASFFL